MSRSMRNLAVFSWFYTVGEWIKWQHNDISAYFALNRSCELTYKIIEQEKYKRNKKYSKELRLQRHFVYVSDFASTNLFQWLFSLRVFVCASVCVSVERQFSFPVVAVCYVQCIYFLLLLWSFRFLSHEANWLYV